MFIPAKPEVEAVHGESVQIREHNWGTPVVAEVPVSQTEHPDRYVIDTHHHTTAAL